MLHFLLFIMTIWAAPADDTSGNNTSEEDASKNDTEDKQDTESQNPTISVENLEPENLQSDIEVLTGEIYINNEQPGFRVYVDGLDTEKEAPILLSNIPIGEHQVELRTECTYQRKKIVVREGLVERAEFQLTPFDVEKPPMEEVIINSKPEGAIIVLNGEEVGNTPWRGPVPCGTHDVETRIFGYLPQRDSFHASMFDSNEVLLTLKPEEYGTLVVKPSPLQTKIIMNGIEEGSGPMSFPDIPVGSYRLEFSAPGYQDAREVVKIRDGEIETLEVYLLPEGSRGANPVRKSDPTTSLYISTSSALVGSALAYLSLSYYSQGKLYFDEYLEIASDSQANAFYDANVLPYRNRSIGLGLTSGVLYAVSTYFFMNRGMIAKNTSEDNSITKTETSSEKISDEISEKEEASTKTGDTSDN